MFAFSKSQILCYILFFCLILKSDGSELFCEENYFECQPHGCLSREQICQLKYDCLNIIGDINCNVISMCKRGEFPCSNGKCIKIANKCDKSDDCGDNSDEISCKHCSSGFSCGNSCLPSHWVCDRYKDCDDGSDESRCISSTIPLLQCSFHEGFQCKNKLACISTLWVCDGDEDCFDGSDEHSCMLRNHTEIISHIKETHICDENMFQCESSECIPINSICNEIPDCEDLSDEGTFCEVTCGNNSECSHDCHMTLSGLRCSCRDGYVLSSDLKTCMDTDECLEVGSCGQKCVNTDGSYHCLCLQGYLMDLNGRDCSPQDFDAAIFYSRKNIIYSVGLNGTHEKIVLKDSHYRTIIDFEIDYVSLRVFWINDAHKGVLKQNINGSKKHILFPFVKSKGISMDVINQILYIINEKKRSLMACAVFKLHKCITLVSYKNRMPTAIAVDSFEKKLFWISMSKNDSRIEMSHSNGQRRQVLVERNLLWPISIALDHTKQRIYWADIKLHVIETVRYDGKDRLILYSKASTWKSFSLDVFGNYIFWTDFSAGSIQGMDLFNSSDERSIVHSKSYPLALRIFKNEYKIPLHNECDTKSCSHLCLRSPSGPTCHCPHHFKYHEFSNMCTKREVAGNLSTKLSNFLTTNTTMRDISSNDHPDGLNRDFTTQTMLEFRDFELSPVTINISNSLEKCPQDHSCIDADRCRNSLSNGNCSCYDNPVCIDTPSVHDHSHFTVIFVLLFVFFICVIVSVILYLFRYHEPLLVKCLRIFGFHPEWTDAMEKKELTEKNSFEFDYYPSKSSIIYTVDCNEYSDTNKLLP